VYTPSAQRMRDSPWRGSVPNSAPRPQGGGRSAPRTFDLTEILRPETSVGPVAVERPAASYRKTCTLDDDRLRRARWETAQAPSRGGRARKKTKAWTACLWIRIVTISRTVWSAGSSAAASILAMLLWNVTIAAAARGRERMRVRGRVTREACEEGWQPWCGARHARRRSAR
jgi:hypothetical protein